MGAGGDAQLRSGRCARGARYLKPLLELIENGTIDPSFIVAHRLPLEDAPRAYRMFRDKQDSCIKIVLKPSAQAPTVQSVEERESGRALH